VAKILPHARRQMARRNISEEEVEQVLDSPELSYPSHVPGRHVFARTIGERRIAVVVFDAERDRVVTTFDQLSNG
jgi:Domain of unknown function (DUF4258)